MKNPRKFKNELEDLVLKHSEKHQVIAVLLASHLFSTYMQTIHLLQQVAGMEERQKLNDIRGALELCEEWELGDTIRNILEVK